MEFHGRVCSLAFCEGRALPLRCAMLLPLAEQCSTYAVITASDGWGGNVDQSYYEQIRAAYSRSGPKCLRCLIKCCLGD